MDRIFTCGTCRKEKSEHEMVERYSFGIYAGRYCFSEDDRCWKSSPYRDATDPDAKFAPMDAGETLEPEE